MCRFFSKKCRHKYTPFVDEEGYQYCIMCNAARKVPEEKEEEKHQHKWVYIQKINVYGENGNGNDLPICQKRVYECSDPSYKEVKVIKI